MGLVFEAVGAAPMGKVWWVELVQWTVWGIAMAGVMGWVARSRLKSSAKARSGQLHHPKSTLVVGEVCFVFFAGIAIVSNVYANETTTWWTTALFVGFAAMAVPVVMDYFLSRHEVSEEGLRYGGLSGRRGHLRWAELQRVRYAPVMKWFRLEGGSGEVARISAMLVGLPEFARLLLRHAPAGTIEDDTLQILKATAEGNPPPVW